MFDFIRIVDILLEIFRGLQCKRVCSSSFDIGIPLTVNHLTVTPRIVVVLQSGCVFPVAHPDPHLITTKATCHDIIIKLISITTYRFIVAQVFGYLDMCGFDRPRRRNG